MPPSAGFVAPKYQVQRRHPTTGVPTGISPLSDVLGRVRALRNEVWWVAFFLKWVGLHTWFVDSAFCVHLSETLKTYAVCDQETVTAGPSSENLGNSFPSGPGHTRRLCRNGQGGRRKTVWDCRECANGMKSSSTSSMASKRKPFGDIHAFLCPWASKSFAGNYRSGLIHASSKTSCNGLD